MSDRGRLHAEEIKQMIGVINDHLELLNDHEKTFIIQMRDKSKFTRTLPRRQSDPLVELYKRVT